MPETLIQSSLTRENQFFFLNDTEINGVQGLRIDYKTNLTNQKYLGLNSDIDVMRGNQVGNLNFSVSVVTHDQILPFTGESPANGGVYKRDTFEGVCFTQAYLTSYSSRYAFGQVPQIDASFLCLGDVGNLPRSEISENLNIFNQSTGLLLIPGPGCLNINLDEFATNRILAYDINIAVNRTPVYAVGNRYPLEVYTAKPIDITCSFQFEVNDYSLHSQNAYPSNPVVRNANLALTDYKTNATILSYSFSNLRLLSESYDVSQNGNSVVNATYKTFIV